MAEPGAWSRLKGKIADEVFAAPRTGVDARTGQDWPPPHERSVGYLERNVLDKPWRDHLALLVAVCSAHRLEVHSVRGIVGTVNARLSRLFPALGLTAMSDWDPDEHLAHYLAGSLLAADTQMMRTQFWSSYSKGVKHVASWLKALPDSEREAYRQLVLPWVKDVDDIARLAMTTELKLSRRKHRKDDTDAVLPHFLDIRAEAHFRFNRMARLRQAYYDALREVARSKHPALPVTFSYDEGGDPEKGIAAEERFFFRVWDRRSFVLAHADVYSKGSVEHALKGVAGFSDSKNRLFLEFVRAERLHDEAPPRGFWFAEILRQNVLGLSASRSGDMAAKQRWLRSWGYGSGRSHERAQPFISSTPGLLTETKADSSFMAWAQVRSEGVLVPVEPFYAAAAVGLLAVDLFTTTGMRINEAMQVRLSMDCFVRLVMPAPPGADDQRPRERFLFRLIPKGERRNRPADYYIGRQTLHVLTKVVEMLAVHYALPPGEPLPSVAFSPINQRAHRFPAAPYVFQYAGQHVSERSINACMRFLLHSMVFKTREDKPVIVKAHLLRHAFATHAVQVEKVPRDIVGEWLKQKNLEVTDYYSKPTDSLIAESADRLLARLAANISVSEAVTRLPEELQQLYEEAQGKVGTLTEVLGGQCVVAGYCPAKFVCVGCAGNVPDPARRASVEQKMSWALEQADVTTREGLPLEAERMRQLARDCAVMLHEMDQIDAYRRDEQRAAFVSIDSIH